jgi:hypothetical protein
VGAASARLSLSQASRDYLFWSSKDRGWKPLPHPQTVVVGSATTPAMRARKARRAGRADRLLIA